MTDDWKSMLSSLRDDLPAGADEPPTDTEVQAQGDRAPRIDPRRLRITVERKGRAGKCATIISGFDGLTDEQLRQVATDLKRALATGGSARGGEILIQGDRAADVRNYFTKNRLK